MKSIIIYATKHGSTEKAAQSLKSKMNGDVVLVNIMKNPPPSLEEFDQVILGGSIYIGKIQKKLSNYVAANLSILLKKRVGLFICAGHEESTVRTQELKDAFPSELYEHALAKEIVGHEFQLERLNFLEKMILKSKGVTSSSSHLSEQTIETFATAINS